MTGEGNIVFYKCPYFYGDMMIYVHTIDQERHRCQILNRVQQSCHVGNGLTSYDQFMVLMWSLADLKNQPVGSLCVTHILPFCSYFKGQEQICFNPTSWHLVTYNFL